MKPVAWMHKQTGKLVVFGHTPKHDFWIPLYTHPQKELSDEEIKIIAMQFEKVYVAYTDHAKNTDVVAIESDMLGFARAIIKASRGEE